MHKAPFLLLLLSSLTLVMGCRHELSRPAPVLPPPPPSPTAWLAADSQNVADSLVDEVIRRGWVREFHAKTTHAPVVGIGPINDRSDREIDVAVLTQLMSRALISRADVHVVAPKSGPTDFTLAITLSFNESEQGAVRYYEFDARLLDQQGEPVGTPYSLEIVKKTPPIEQ